MTAMESLWTLTLYSIIGYNFGTMVGRTFFNRKINSLIDEQNKLRIQLNKPLVPYPSWFRKNCYFIYIIIICVICDMIIRMVK